MKLSEKQKAIDDAWKNGDKNILINAVAGSGKTTTLLNLLASCQYRVLFLAFNKSIQEEIQSKIDERGLIQGKAMTIHSLGLMALRNYSRKVRINKGKNFDIVKKVQKAQYSIFRKYQWKDKLKITYNLMDMNDISRLFLTDDIDKIAEVLETTDKKIVVDRELKSLWQTVLDIRKDYDNSMNLEIDFIDMLYLPVVKDLTIPIQTTYLMIDEAQDLSLVQHKLIDKLLSQGVKKWVAVGDRNQAIYAFAGSFTESFDLFLDKGNVEEFPLDICYRCDKSIIESANEVYDIMIPFKEEEGIVDDISDINEVKPNSMVICRNTKPLIDLYFQLLSVGKSCYIEGEDILNPVIRFLNPYKKKGVFQARKEMELEIERLTVNAKSESERIALYLFKERYETFKLLSKYLIRDEGTIYNIIEKLNTMYIVKENAIKLCTIHKSKGLESDVVYILDEFLIPSRFARSREQLKQEENLRYVARTRAKNELYFLTIEEQEEQANF